MGIGPSVDSGDLDATVVIPAHNEHGSISQTLDALYGQDADVIVVAGGNDGTEVVAKEHPTVNRVIEDTAEHPTVNRVIEDTAENGPAAARNRGVRAAETAIVCFTDADTIVRPGWVTRHLRHYRNPDVVGVGGPLRPFDADWTDEVLFTFLSDWWYRVSWLFGFVQASGNNCSYRREPFLDAGGFDESLSFIEDTDCSLRMNRRGKVVFDPHAMAETSVRRQAETGYFCLFLTYVVGYSKYVLGRDPGGEYFRKW